MQEFVYFNENKLDFPLPECIHVTSELPIDTNNDYIISNSHDIHAEVIADEIDFYISNSNDSIPNKIKNVQKLYEINATRFDMAQDIDFTQEVASEVLLVATAEQKEEFAKLMVPDEFNLFYVPQDTVLSISGHIGNLTVFVNHLDKKVELKVSQIVWFNQNDIAKLQSGTFDPLESSVDDVLATLRTNMTNYSYKNFTVYDQNICQYHERREEVCGKCVEVCPTVAIIKIDEKKHLNFSHVDCHGCGGCISVCPSGALDYAPTSRETIFEMAKQFKGHIPLIVPQKMDIRNLNIQLKENVLPFAIEGEKFLHEGTFLTLLQESGSQLVFYSDFLSKGVKDSISILNDVYQKKYGFDAILVAMTKEELPAALESANFVDNSRFTFSEPNSNKREIFSLRLGHLVGEDDFGTIKTGEHIHYSTVEVNESKCTLCLSCVGACNVDALRADPLTNELKLNASICTSCGYCESSCPELDCLTIKRDEIELKPSWFKENVIAKDTLFACIECGVEFATTKAVEKIAAMMGPLFASNPTKHRTLYCCEDCKPKLMIAQGLLDA